MNVYNNVNSGPCTIVKLKELGQASDISSWTLSVEAPVMMTSSNGNVFRVSGHLCGEFTGNRWIPRTKASDAELWCFLFFICAWINGWVNSREAGDLRRHRAHYDVTVMCISCKYCQYQACWCPGSSCQVIIWRHVVSGDFRGHVFYYINCSRLRIINVGNWYEMSMFIHYFVENSVRNWLKTRVSTCNEMNRNYASSQQKQW